MGLRLTMRAECAGEVRRRPPIRQSWKIVFPVRPRRIRRRHSARVGAGARPPAAAVTRTRARAARLQRSAARGIVGTAV